ncbi:hypothetical protein HMI55_005613 [Coelomomyces lativittatus]|nr:hypothetical protein HMI55_005613 [Coelomomyces lativittatus]
MTASFYETASQLLPKIGKPCSQLAVLRSIEKNYLGSIYWHLRSVSATEPCPSAKEYFFSFIKEHIEQEVHTCDFLRFFSTLLNSDQSLNVSTLFPQFSSLRKQVSVSLSSVQVVFILLVTLTELMYPTESDLLSLPVRSLLTFSLAIHVSLNDLNALMLLTAWICSQTEKVKEIALKSKCGEIRHLLPEHEPLAEAFQSLISYVDTLHPSYATPSLGCWTAIDFEYLGSSSLQPYYSSLTLQKGSIDFFRIQSTINSLQPYVPLCVPTPTRLLLPNPVIKAVVAFPDCLVSYWHIIKQWIETKTYLLLVPLFVLEELDRMKKSSAATRDVIRQLEAYVKREHPHVHLLPSQASTSLPPVEQLFHIFPHISQLYHEVFVVTTSQDILLHCRELGMECEFVTSHLLKP